MNKNLQLIMLTTFGLGLLIFTLSNLFKGYLPEFILGFCEGMSIVFIISGCLYLCCCFVKKRIGKVR